MATPENLSKMAVKRAIAVVEAPVMPWSRVRCIMRQSSKKCRRGQMKLAQMLAL